MLRVFGILLVSGLVVALAWWLAGLPGEVSISAFGYRLETATPLAIVIVVVVILLIHTLLRWVRSIWRVRRTLRDLTERRRRVRGDQAVSRTLVALAAADPDAALREARRARELLGDTPQTLLLAAESGRLSGGEAQAEAIYRQLAARDDASFLGLRGLFRQAVAREDWAGAAALARQAEAVRPGALWLRDERTMLAVRTGDWNQALALAGKDGARVAYATAAADAAIDPGTARKLAKRAWQDDPGFTPAALAYARRLRAAGRESRAQEVLREAWRLAPQPELAEFSLATTTDKATRLREAGRFVQNAPNHPESHLLLARVALDAGQTTEARRHIDAARQGGLNQHRFWLLVADLEARENGNAEAQREALRRAAVAEPDPAWRCDVCGTAHPAWHPACPACHTPGRLRWGAPAPVAPPRISLAAT